MEERSGMSSIISRLGGGGGAVLVCQRRLFWRRWAPGANPIEAVLVIDRRGDDGSVQASVETKIMHAHAGLFVYWLALLC